MYASASLISLASAAYVFRSYNEAIATIRRVPSLEHNFQLVITRVYEEGDQELLEDEDESAPNSLLAKLHLPCSSRRREGLPYQRGARIQTWSGRNSTRGVLRVA